MAGTSDSRASSFIPADFRDAIRFAMNMGLPEDSTERATFRWLPQRDWAIEDQAGYSYDFSSTPVSEVLTEDVQVPVAVEFVSNRSENGTSMGEFDNPRVVITVLDEEYEQVKTANQVLLGGNTYWIRYWSPPVGLFSVTVYQAYLTAEDES